MNHYQAQQTTVVLLAAGHGKRMRPLTNTVPKPLLKVGDHALIEHHLYRLAEYGFKNIVINLAYLGEQIRDQLLDGRKYGLNIRYSDEAQTGALETAGGLKKALPLIQSDPFLVVNSDIWTDFNFTKLLMPLKGVGRLVLVDNPPHNPNGDFGIDETNWLNLESAGKLTFSGVALYKKSIFTSLGSGKCALAPVLHALITRQNLEGVEHKGVWVDVGSPERLTELNTSFELQQNSRISGD